ncbi:MAG TPA: diguanylate cyclase [Rubrivivax sp.]|nr:diguanylate cyclase [Rubrivivax sp.]
MLIDPPVHALVTPAPPTAACMPVAEPPDRATRAWELSYLDPIAARDIGRELIAQGGTAAVMGWLHVALVEVRVGEVTLALDALHNARSAFTAAGDARGQALCDEVQAIALRRAGDPEGSARLQAAIDARATGDARDAPPMQRFIAHNSRAITAKVLGHVDEALRHFYAASDAAHATGWAGPRITALGNLGGYQQELYNLEDARELSERALRLAREAGARPMVATAASNLVIIHHAAGEPAQARAMAEFLLTHPEELMPHALEQHALPLALAHLGAGELSAAEHHLRQAPASHGADIDEQTFRAWLQARCLLARGNAAAARELAGQALAERRRGRQREQSYNLLELHRVMADACEALGDAVAALACVRQAHALYEKLVGRSARARWLSLQAGHQLAQAQRERDLALDSRRSVEDDRRRLAELNAALHAQIAQTEMLHARLREQALRDPLTGLHNRRYLFEMAPGLLELARRQGTQLCVVLIDLDHFKLLNDTYGHQAGDLVLQRFAALLTRMLRRSDVVCRHGGEEFVAVMPDISADGAETMLGRLLEAFQAQREAYGTRRLPHGSFSAGIARFPRHGNTLEQLLSRADRALYAAKNHGRARIEQAPRTGFGTLL